MIEPVPSDRPAHAAAPSAVRTGLAASFRVVSFGTLLSRILGLVRDMLLASVFGAGPILDAFTLSFRLPNLARQLFGEGALTAAFLPIFVRELCSADPTPARQLASAMFWGLASVLAAIVIIVEAVLLALLAAGTLSANVRLLLVLVAIQMPYLLCICLAAQLSAVLHSLRRFFWPAVLPVCLNLVWLAGIGVAALPDAPNETRIQIVAVSVVAGGVVQLAIAVWATAKLGYTLRREFGGAWVRVREVTVAMLPIVLGFAISQLNVLTDSLIAWAAANTSLGTLLPVPIAPGTATALFFAQRMYQFPLGIFGVALGTVLFPLLASHAQAGDQVGLRRDLSHGLRLTIAIGVPASAGLVVLSRPITALLFERGAFDASDAALTATMVAIYGSAVWAYIGVLIAYRGFYAIGDRMAPVRISTGIVIVNLALNAVLVCTLGGVGLALGGAVSAAIQALVAMLQLQTRVGRLKWGQIMWTGIKTLSATVAMTVACVSLLRLLPDGSSIVHKAVTVVAPMLTGIAIFLLAARLFDLREPWDLLKSREPRVEGQ